MASRSLAAELDVSLRTRPLIAQDIGETILEEVESEGAAHVFVGWRGSFGSNEYAFGSNLYPVLTDTTVDVTLVNPRGPPRGRRGGTRHGRRRDGQRFHCST